MHFMVSGAQRGLQRHLIRCLYREELFEELTVERDDVAARRAAAQEASRTCAARSAAWAPPLPECVPPFAARKEPGVPATVE